MKRFRFLNLFTLSGPFGFFFCLTAEKSEGPHLGCPWRLGLLVFAGSLKALRAFSSVYQMWPNIWPTGQMFGSATSDALCYSLGSPNGLRIGFANPLARPLGSVYSLIQLAWTFGLKAKCSGSANWIREPHGYSSAFWFARLPQLGLRVGFANSLVRPSFGNLAEGFGTLRASGGKAFGLAEFGKAKFGGSEGASARGPLGRSCGSPHRASHDCPSFSSGVPPGFEWAFRLTQSPGPEGNFPRGKFPE